MLWCHAPNNFPANPHPQYDNKVSNIKLSNNKVCAPCTNTQFLFVTKYRPLVQSQNFQKWPFSIMWSLTWRWVLELSLHSLFFLPQKIIDFNLYKRLLCHHYHHYYSTAPRLLSHLPCCSMIAASHLKHSPDPQLCGSLIPLC